MKFDIKKHDQRMRDIVNPPKRGLAKLRPLSRLKRLPRT